MSTIDGGGSGEPLGFPPFVFGSPSRYMNVLALKNSESIRNMSDRHFSCLSPVSCTHPPYAHAYRREDTVLIIEASPGDTSAVELAGPDTGHERISTHPRSTE